MQNCIRFILVLFSLCIYAQAQTITSTTTGGNWENAATWVGGVIPTQASNVIINGTVSVTTSNSICNNLTINSGKILQNGGGYGWVDLHVKGSIINNGVIRNNPDGRSLDVECWGNLQNNGEITIWYLYLPMQNTQYISQGTGKFFNAIVRSSDAAGYGYSTGKIIAASDLTFKNNIYFSSYIINVGNRISTLDMAGYNLTISGDAQLYNIVVKNAGSITTLNNAYIHSTTFEGNTTIKGTGRIDNSEVYFKNDLTVADTLQNGGGYGWLTVHIEGNLINNGFIRNNLQGRSLNVEAWRNVYNNGILNIWYLYLPGKNTQYISQSAGKYFNAEVKCSDAGGYGYGTGNVTAASDLTFKKSVNFRSSIANVGDKTFTLDMGGNNLILSGDAQIFNTIVKNAASITTLDNSYIYSTTIEGNTAIKGTGRIDDSEVYFKNNLTVTDTLQNGGGYGWLTVHIEGTLTNNGIIKNNWAGNSLQVEAWSDVYNNGLWMNSQTYFPAKNVQHISQAAGKVFDTKIRRSDAGGYGYITGNLIAASDLTFKKESNLAGYVVDVGDHWGQLDMANYNLTLSGDAQLFSGSVKDVNFITILDNAYVYNLSFEGRTSMKGRGRVDNSNVSFTGTLIVVDTLQNGGGYGWLTPIVYGDVINYGVVKNNYQGNSLCLDVRGNIYNYGYWNIWQTHLKTEGMDRFVSGTFNTSFYINKSGTPAGGNIYVDGSFVSENEIRFVNGALLIINPGSAFVNKGTIIENGFIINNGTFTSTHSLLWSDPCNAGLNAGVAVTDRKDLENVTVIYNANVFHPQMTSSTKQWWRFTPKGEVGAYKLTLIYDPELLNGMDPNQLEVFMSPDSGLSWTKISTPINISRDFINNSITVGTNEYPVTSGFGDFILSTGETIPIPSIASAIGGRRQIRVGPPNRYTISYWNNGDTPTDMFCYQLQTNGGVHIKSIITKNIETDELVEISIDSLNYDGYKDEVLLFVQPLAPDEVRSFDIILTAEPDVIGKQKELITFTAVALWVGGAILEEYISNTMVEGCYEMWRPVAHDQSLTDASVNCLKNSMQKAVTFENGAKGIAKKAAGEIIEKTGRVAVWPVMLAKDLFDCLGNTVKGMKDYVNGNFDKQGKDLTKVTSWDPNAKEGPEGYGDMGYLASSAPMLYTIFFENKKEATGAAYQVTIYDTLDQDVYDINTVQFLGMSHNMGITSQQGNILKWEFTGIELVPNVTPPEGEGWVKFIVHPKSNLPTGTVLSNKADIKFDLNAWLATNIYVNTLDFEPPLTTPVSLVRLPETHEVVFSWNGNDGNGSGIGSASVYMSINDGPCTVAATSDSSSAKIVISEEVGYKYKFYALSKDNTGNTEKEPNGYLEILTGVDENKTAIPIEFSLKQNYPNPFNPVTTIRYDLPEKGNIKLMIYNLLGEEVATLVNEEKEAGYYFVTWNASAYSSGIYFCKIVYNDKSYVNKMMLLK